MNRVTKRQFKAAVLAGLTLGFSLAQIQAADGNINQFNSAGEVGQWRFDFGQVSHTAEFDATVDANGNGASGSMKIILGFNTALGGENKAAYTRDAFFPGVNGAEFSGLQMDLRIDAGSAMDAFGNNGFFSLAIRNTDGYNYVQQFGDNVRSADGWRHINASPLTAPYDAIRAITWQLYGGPAQNINGTVTLWIDNVVFTPVPEPATLLLAALGVIGLLASRFRRSRG
jgi:PEP-CTERM motif